MQILLYAIALVWSVSGFLVFSHPESSRSFCQRFFPPSRVKQLAPLPAALGVVLLLGAFTTDTLFWPLAVLGALGVAKGLYLFATPLEKLTRLLDEWLFMVDLGTVRRYGILIFCLGMALMSIAA